MGILTERIEKANKELSKSGGELAGIDLVDDREKAIVERHKSELQGGSLMQRAAKGLASLEIKDRRQKREYAENPPTLLSKTTVDFAREMLANLGDRARVLDVYRKLSPEQREEALRLAPGIAQIGGDDRGGFIGRAGSSLARGVSAVSQPIMELAGQVTGTDWGGSAEEIDFIRKLEGAAAQEFNPARPGDPWYERGPVQAAEMLPWMATTVGGAGAGRAVLTGVAGRLAGSAAAGSKIAGAVQKAGQAVGNLPTKVPVVGKYIPALTAAKAGELAGITAAAFPSQYAQEVDQLKALGMADDIKLRLLASGTAAVTGLVEGIVPNPFGASVPLKEGAVKAARQYLWEAAKKAPGEMTEEYLQGVVSGLGEHVSQYIASQETGVGEDGAPAKKPLQKKSIADAFDKGWQQAQEAALPMAFLLGGSAVGGAALSAARATGAPDASQSPFGQNFDNLSQNPADASRMPPVAPVQPSPPPLPAGAPPAPMQPPLPPVQPPPISPQAPSQQFAPITIGGKVLTPEMMSSIAALDDRPSAHKWAEIVLGDRKLFKKAPIEAERVQAWEQSRAASQTQGGAVPPIPGQVPVTTEGVDNGVRQQSEPQVEQGVQQDGQSQAAVGQNAGGQVDEERMRNEAEVRAQLEADRAQRLAARNQQQGETPPPAAPEAGAIGEKTTVMGTPAIRANAFTDVDNVRYELFESQDGKSGIVRTMDVDSGNVVSMKKFPSVSAAQKAFEKEQKRQAPAQPATAPGTISAEDISGTMESAGAAMAAGLYDKVWGDLQSGSLKKMEKPPLFEQLAIKGYDRGVIKSVEDLRSISEGMTGDFNTDKEVGIKNLNRLVEKYKTEVPAEPKEATKEWKRDERVFVQGHTTSSGGKIPNSVGEIYKVNADSVVVKLDGETGYRSVPKDKLQLPDAKFSVGEVVGLPWSNEGEGKVVSVLPDGRYELSVVGRRVVEPADRMVKLPKTESAPENQEAAPSVPKDILTPSDESSAAEIDRRLKKANAEADNQDLELEGNVPSAKTPEEHAAIPMFGVYQSSFRGKKKFFVKEFENKGSGDSMFDSLEEANKQAEIARRRDSERKQAADKAKAEEDASRKKQEEYEASFSGFLSDDAMTKGRQLKALGASRKYQDKVASVKDIVEQKVADGAVVDDQGRLMSPDGSWLGSDKITKTGIDYARHLLSKKTEPAAESKVKTDAFRALPKAGQAAFEAEWEKGTSSIKNILYPNNKAYRAEFEARTGVKLPKTVGGTFEAVENWNDAGRLLAGDAPVLKGESPADKADEAQPTTKQNFDNLSQKPEGGLSASEIRGMLDSVRQRIASQGQVVDDRLISRERELARLLAEAEKAEETKPKAKAEEVSNEPETEPRTGQSSAGAVGQNRVPVSELGVKGNSATVSTADGKTRKVTYYAIEADSLIPSHDARNKFSKNEGALENERPYHDPKQGADSRDTVEKISKVLPDKIALLTSDTPSPIDGPPILDAFGAVLGGNARSMGMQLAYAGDQAARLKAHMQSEASKFGIDAEQVKNLKEPVIVRVLDEVFDKATISALLNQALSAAMSQPTVAVSQAKRVSESTIGLISGILSSDDTLSLRDAMANPKHADRIVSALMKDGAWSSKDKDRFVDPVTADLNSDGKSAIEQLLTAKVIPDASILGEVAPSVKQKVLAAIGPLAKGMADKKHGKQLLSDMLEAVKAYDGYVADKKAGGSLQSYFMDQEQLIQGPGYRNYTAAGLVHALHEMSPAKFRNAMKELVSALGIGEKTASLFNEMNETFETLPEAIKSVIDPPLRDAPVTAPAQTDADADMKALIESIMDEEDAVKPPAKKKTGRKEQGGPAPAPRKKTGKKQKTTEEAKTPLKSAADQARKEADDIWAEWIKQSSSKLTTGLDGDLARLAVRLVLAEIKANTLTFAAFVEKTVAKLPAELLEKSKPYMEMAWKVAYERKKTEDPGGKFDDYMKKGDENEQSVYDGTGESDKEGTVRGGSDGQESGGSATSGALEETQPADGQATGGAGVAGGLRDGDSGSIQQGGDEAVADGADSNVGGGTGVTGDVAAGSGDEAGFTKPGDGAGIHLAPKSSRPNFHLTNPDVIIGRGLKDKFARNVRALELSQELEESGRPPTQEDLEILASYIGWGAFGQELFQGNWNNPKVKKEWIEENEWLREHLGEEEWRSAQESIPNAHYTDPEVVSGMWTMLQKMGFNGGRFLEPSFGVGNFAALMPRDIMGRTNFTAIELDKATARIAKILYPQINVQQKAYQDSKTPNDFYDVTATNVPFGNYKIHDRTYRMPYSVHNYFFRKAIDQTKPGGIMAFITSNMTMDGKDEAKFLRKQLSDRGDLIAAFRFPTGAFERYAKTKVVADLIIIRKRRPGDAPSKTNEEWIDVVDIDTPSGQKTSVNNYWTLHPENVLGTLNYGNGTTNGRPGMVVNKPDDLESRWQKAIESVPENILNTDRSPEEGKERPNERKLRQNTVVHQNDELYIAKGEQLMPLKEYVNWYTKGSKPETIKKKRDEIVSLLKVRDALEKVLEVQGKGDDASAQRKELNQAYDAFVGEYGPVSESKALEKLKGSGDAIANAVASLEEKTPSGEYEKRPVFTKNTVRQPPRVNEKLDPVDAFALARNNSVDIDWDKVAYSARMPKKDVIAALEAKGMIYKVGEDAYDAADVFLSGNMARKIRQLEAAKNEGVAGLDRSIKAARDAMPEPLAYSQIQVSLGAPWITAKDYSQFFADLLNDSPKNTTIIKAARGWKVQFPPSTNRLPGVVTHGHSEVAFSKLVAAAMNNGRVSVYYEDAGGNKIRDDIATAEANAKIDELKDKFKDWIWQTPDRIARLSQAYNEDHRSVVTPDWNNIEVPLLFEGLALQRGDDPFSLRKHQEAAVWRGIVSGKGLFAHEVGTGKTLTMVALAIESRRLRLANKPVIFAHNANSEAVYREAQEAYPGAKILYVNNLDPKNKGQAMASIATEDWDLIVIPHSLVENLKMRPETLEKLLQDQMDQLEAAALEAYEEDDSPFKGNMPGDLDNISKDDLKSLRSRTAKELVKERLRLRERIRAAQADAANESTVFIEDMGIDMLMVDEAHIFKKIPLATRQQVKGLNKRASNPGNSLLLLSDYIRGTQNGRGVFLFTGTPITNTLNEIYNMQRFIMPDEMEAVGVKDWDGWFSTFATSESSDELSAGGTYEEFERLTSFVNLPELRASIGQYMDTVFGSDMPEFIPRDRKEGRVEEGEPVIGRPYKEVHNETLQMMPVQKRLSEQLKERYRTLREATGKQKYELMRTREYMPLVINNEGVKLALDPRLMDGVSPSSIDPRDPRLKVNKMIVNAMDYYYSHPKATQMIFMEIGHTDSTERVVGRDNDGNPITERVKIFNLAKEIKRRLMEEGVAESEIAIFSAMTKEQRSLAARAMNRGEIRFAIGGTETIGTGVNAQENLVAMHHMDAPWMPGALEQRNGRGHRQGNRWNTVHEHRYLTEGPQDGRRWQVLLTKYRFISRFMHYKGDERVIDMSDVDMDEGGQGDFEATFSAAVGDPRIQQRFRLEKEIAKLEDAKNRHHRTIQDSLWESHKQETQDLPHLREVMNSLLSVQEAYRNSRPEKGDAKQSAEPSMIVMKSSNEEQKVVTGSEAITQALEQIQERYSSRSIGQMKKVGEYRGVDVFTTGDVMYVGNSRLEIKPAFSSLDGILRNVGKRIENYREEYGRKLAFINSAKESAKLPFVRQAQLDAKKSKLAALTADMEENPQGSPFWFRNMAPVGSSIYIRKKKRAAGRQAFDDMQAEMYREALSSQDADQNARYEFEEHAVAGYRSDTHIAYEDGTKTVAVPIKDVLNEQGDPIFKDIEDVRAAQEKADDISSPELDKKLEDLPDTLAQMESGDVDASIRKQVLDIAMAAEDAGIKTFDKLVAYSVKSVGERRTREIGAYLRLAAEVVGFEGVRNTSDVLGTPGVTRDQFVTMAKAAFPRSLTDEQINAAVDILERTGLSFDKIGFAPFGSPVPPKLEEIAQQGQGTSVKGWTQFVSATRAIIGATDKADVSTFIHEMFHPMRRFLLNRNVPLEERQGITDADIQALEDYAGVKDGKWTREAEEKAAMAWEQYWFEGRSPSKPLTELFKKIARWMRGVYSGIYEITGGQLPSEVRALFGKLVQRSGDTEIFDNLSKNEDPVVSIKNEVVNDLRFRRGVPGLEDVAQQTQEEWLDAATTMLRNDPMLGDHLVKEINSKARNLSNIEVAVMQIHYRQMNNRLIEASDRLFKAKDKGDPVASAQALTDTDIIQNALSEIEEAAKAAGREWGRAGVARQIELDRDYSLVGLIRKARIANAGNALNEEQLAKIRELAARVAELEGDLARANQEKADLERQKNVDAQIEDSKKKATKVPEALRRKAVDSLATFKNKFAAVFALSSNSDSGTLYATQDEMMADEAKFVVQAYVDDIGVFFFGEFMANVRKDLGSELPVSVRAAFATAWQELHDNGDIPSPMVDKNDVRGLTRLAKQIERALVESGITERDAVVQGVWESLQEVIPEITERETMDAMSGYGQYSPPSNEQNDKIIADINAQLLQLAKLDDMRSGIAPAKTGVGRQEPSPELRDLIRQVNQQKRDGKYRVTDESTQLKTAIGAAKTALSNRIYDLNKAINVTKQPIVGSEKRGLSGKDAELDALRKQRDELMAQYKLSFPKPAATMDERIAATNQVLDRVISDLEEQLRTGEFEAKKKSEPISTPELDAKRARIEALRAQRDAIVGVKKRTPEQIEKAYKANLLKQIADYKERMAKSEFDPKPKKEIRALSKDELRLKMELAEVKDEFFRMAADYRLANMSPRERAWDYFKETMHLSRALMTSLDASAVFRQGGAVAFSHPVMGAAVAWDMYKAMMIKESGFNTAEQIRKDKDYQFAVTAGLQITEEEGKIVRQEEAFMGRWARDGFGKQGSALNKFSKFVLWPVASSARGYMTFLNGIRFQLFKHFIATVGRGGQVTADEAKVIAMYINAATGRSDLGPMLRWAEQMNMLFFAPRFVASRFQYLGLPLWLLGSRKVSGRVKKAIAMEYVRHATVVMSFLGLTVALGRLLSDDEEEKPTVSLDPRSSDFLKIKIGETRIDPMSGLSQVIVLASRIATGQRVRTDGEVVSLRGEDVPYGEEGMSGGVGKFLRTKLAPIPGAALDIATGENVVGQPMTPYSSIVNLFVPLSIREIGETAEARGIPQGTLITLLSLHGMGASTYGPESNYRKANASQRQEQFAKDLKRIEFDSPDPAYKGMLTKEQMAQVRQRREEKKQGLVYAATSSPDRKTAKSVESYNQSLAEQKAALESLKRSGVTLTEARQLLIKHWDDKYGSAKEMRGGVSVYKPALSDRLQQLRKVFSK